MENLQNFLNELILNPWIVSGLSFGIVFIALTALRRLIWSKLSRWAAQTHATWDNDLLSTINRPVALLMFVIAFGIAGQSAPPLVKTHPLMIYGVKSALLVVIIWIVERASTVILFSSAISESVTVSTRTLLVTIVRVILGSLGVLIVLDTLGVSITPVLASLGVGSVAVALALQDTLSNFFGGLYLLFDKPIRIGDYVKLDEIEGQVDRIGWRGTWLRTMMNETVVLPNNKAASALLKNYDLPKSSCMISVPCGVDYDADLEKVERVVLEVAREVLSSCQGADESFVPQVRFTTFGDSSINFNAILQAKRFSEVGLVRSQFIKALHVRFKKESIEIPFPQRVVHYSAHSETAMPTNHID